jgi:hypothetical protein
MPEEEKNKIPQFPTSTTPIATSGASSFGSPFIPNVTGGFNQRVSSQAAQGTAPQFVRATQAGKEPISVASGTIFATPQQASAMTASRNIAEQGTRTPEQQQALLAQMRERGSQIRQDIINQNIRPSQEQVSQYYTIRQGMEERRAQEALTPSVYEGGVAGTDRRMAGAQALVSAERWRQAASGERSAMGQSPISAFGGAFRQGSMGQFSPIQQPTYTQGISGMQNMFAPAAQTTPATLLPAMGETRQNATQLGTSGTPFSFTPFAATSQSMADPFRGLRMATSPRRRGSRFTPLPFGLRTTPTV